MSGAPVHSMPRTGHDAVLDLLLDARPRIPQAQLLAGAICDAYEAAQVANTAELLRLMEKADIVRREADGALVPVAARFRLLGIEDEWSTY